MRTDIYTRTVLTVIAILLALNLFTRLVSPQIAAHADGPLSGVQFSANGPYGFWAFDTRNSNVWYYHVPDTKGTEQSTGYLIGRISELEKLIPSQHVN
jgi:hypothetical protein